MSEESRPVDRPHPVSKKPIVKINNYVRKHTRAVDLKTLNQKGITRVNYLTFSKINDLIARAVMRALEKYEKTWSAQHAEKIQEEAREQLKQQLPLARESGDPGQLAREKEKVEEEVQKLRPLVESRLAELKDERKLGPEPEILAITEQSFEQLQRRMGVILSSFLKEEGESYFSHAGICSGSGLNRLQQDLERLVRDTLLVERGRLLDFLAQSVSEKTNLLQRRLEKLKKHLEGMERSLKTLRESADIDEGLPSIYREIQGLSLDDSLFEKKKGLLKIIFEDNLQLQVKDNRDLLKAGHD